MLPSHTRYDYSSIGSRKDYSWPGGKRLAFYVALNVEHFAFRAGRGMDPHQSRRAADYAQLSRGATTAIASASGGCSRFSTS